MSLSGALANAMSGLTAASRSASVTSTNIANAMTEGYSVRNLGLNSSAYGGVAISGITRNTDSVLLGERRTADAEVSTASVSNEFYTRLETLMGTPDQASSISGTFSAFEAALVSATGSPESDIRLQGVADQAELLANKLNDASNGVQSMREEADANIKTMVDDLNGLLAQTEELNLKITQAGVQGKDTSTLLDQRQQTIDKINEMVPVRIMDRDNGAVALYSTSGATMLDGKAYEIEFDQTPTIMPHMTQDNGLLSGLTINGQAISTDPDRGPLSGGALSAQFEVRDSQTVEAQAELDAVARDLIERFQDSSVDPTLAPGDPGLFTDGSGAFDPADEVGLAGRIELNGLVSSDGSGETWRLRDGLGATAPGEVGNSSLLNGLVDTLQTSTVPGSSALGSKAVTMSEMFGNLHSSTTSNRVNSDSALTFATAQQNTFVSMDLAQGVDADSEMQQLMLIEQAYSANAKIIQAVDDMMATILGI